MAERKQGVCNVPKLRFPEFRGAGEWEAKRLLETCDINPSKEQLPPSFIYIDLESVDDGKLICEKKIHLDDAPSRAQRLLKNGDVIYQVVRPYQKNNFFCDFEDGRNYVASTGYALLRAYGESKFLYYIVHVDSFVGQVLEKCTGSNYPAINASDLATVNVAIPQFPEQQKIADCLSSLDDLLTLQSQKLDALKIHKKGLMQQLFPAEGETQPKLRFPEFRGAGEWETRQLKFVCHMQAGKFISAKNIMEQYEKGLYPCYGGNGLRGYTKTYTHSGTYPLIGRQGALCGNINLAVNHFHATEHAVVATPKKDVDANWLFYALELLNLNRYAIGQAQPGLSVEVLEKISIIIPAKKNEQQKIAECLSSLDDLLALQSQKLDALKIHKKGLMQQLFPSPDEACRRPVTPASEESKEKES